jgi:hypothetical protein
MVFTPAAGLDFSNLDSATREEIDAHLMFCWKDRGPLYDMSARSLMTDYAPDFAKRHWLGNIAFQLLPSGEGGIAPINTIPNSICQLHSYMMQGWETGILNQFRVLQQWGFTRSQIMEVVMYSRLAAGMRGLGHVFRAVGDVLPTYADGNGNPPFPEGWAADPAAFKCGLDMSTLDLTPADRTNLTEWYERTIGYVPKSVEFGLRWDPRILKAHRAMWEVAIKTLPKQIVPYLMLRDATLENHPEALREGALLGKAWGLTPDWIVRGITQTMHYFTGMRGLYTAYEAVDDILRDWDKPI